MLRSVSRTRHFANAVAVVVLAVVFGNSRDAPASEPGWWTTSGLKTSDPASDYSPANVGQLKNFAWQAKKHLDTWLPGEGAGQAIDDLVHQWITPDGTAVITSSQTCDFSPANIGQLKAVGELFYARFDEIGFPSSRPWTQTTSDDFDYSPGNIGQLKSVFNFEPGIDTDTDDLPDWWEQSMFENLTTAGTTTDVDGDGVLDKEEFLLGLNPNDLDTDNDGLSDGYEIAVMSDPGSFDTPYQAPGSLALKVFNPELRQLP